LPEAAPMITFTRPGRWKIGAAGRRMPCLEMKTAEGEIVACGRNIWHEAPAPTADMAVLLSVIGFFDGFPATSSEQSGQAHLAAHCLV
jgi:hypothetical protein